MACGKSGAIPRAARAHARPDPSALRRVTEGPEGKSKQACSLLRQGLPRFALPGPLSAAASAWRKKPAGARAGCARVRCRHMDVPVSEPPERACAVRRARMPANRGREGALLFGYFLLGKQEKVTGRQGWRTERTGT